MATYHHLADYPEAVPLVAGWIFDEWGRDKPGLEREGVVTHMHETIDRERLPVHVVARQAGSVVGVASLKDHEMVDLYPEYENWIGSVIVTPSARGQGIAAGLCRHLIELAKAFDMPRLHLQTLRHDGGLYANLGFRPLHEAHYRGYHVMLMTLDLDPS
jgi:predicted N-acetyltransferase YhbS